MAAKKLPKISIITPSLNQGDFIEKTIKSVLSQDYPNIEYIIIDGKSTDNTPDILKKYEKDIILISEKDKNQSNAINKGLKIASGEIIGYLNADDVYEPHALFRISNFFKENPKILWTTGKCSIIDDKGKEIRPFIKLWKHIWQKIALSINKEFEILLVLNYISQPATFIKKELVQKVGFLNEDMEYAMDYEYWLRISRKSKLGYIDSDIARFRIHENSKTNKNFKYQIIEGYKCAKENTNSRLFLFLHTLQDKCTIKVYQEL